MIQNSLLIAALYNLLFGAFAVLFPSTAFQWAGMETPLYPELWQCIGMIVGVYGVGYAIAWRDSNRHWPIVLVGLLGKIFGPIGFVYSVLFQDFPLSFFWVILFNDLIWWPFFIILLVRAYRFHKGSLSTQSS